MTHYLKKKLPGNLYKLLRRIKRNTIRKTRQLGEVLGFNISRKEDYYSPLPTESELLKNIQRWNRPSRMVGVNFDLENNKILLSSILASYLDEYLVLPSYSENTQKGFGLGFTEVDALVLYAMIRHHKPRKYLEVGSGISTYYTSLAAKKNALEDCLLQITCVEPHPFPQLYTIPHIHVIDDLVQNVELERFTSLDAGDVLFIDSSHILRIDGDVPYLYLEVLPVLKPGVIIHIHDIPFPFNVPHPVEQWVTGKAKEAPYWPVFWNEAMLLQAFLAFNPQFEIQLSASMIRHYDEKFLKRLIPIYRTIEDEPNTFSSIWLERVHESGR